MFTLSIMLIKDFYAHFIFTREIAIKTKQTER